MRQKDHLWYRIRYAFWVMWECRFRVTPAFAWDCATAWGWSDLFPFWPVDNSPHDAVIVEMSYWEADE